MKRILTLVWLTAILVCCDIGPRQTSASIKTGPYVDRTIHKVDDIEYHVYSTSYDGGTFVINHTKELLEIELIKKQLEQMREDTE